MTRDEARIRLRSFLVEELGVPEEHIADDRAPLLEAGYVSSLEVVWIVAFCEEELGCTVAPEEIAPDAFRTFGSLVDAVVDRWGAQ